MLTRTKQSTIRTVRGIDVDVQSIETFNYQGNWEPAGFNIRLGLKKIGHYYGYPTDSDLWRLIKQEITP